MRIRSLREGYRISQEELAKAIGSTVEELERWENGIEEPPIAYSLALAEFFNCDVYYILDKEPPARRPSDDIPRMAIKCPHCKSRNLAFVAEYHKVLWARVLQVILFAIFAAILIPAILDPDGQGPILVIVLIVIAILQVYIAITEASSHVKCVCKDCGKTWIHD